MIGRARRLLDLSMGRGPLTGAGVVTIRQVFPFVLGVQSLTGNAEETIVEAESHQEELCAVEEEMERSEMAIE